jgi:hypothetical protein
MQHVNGDNARSQSFARHGRIEKLDLTGKCSGV